MTDVKLSALELLELRAGASDEDRPAWLADRRSGVTATDVRDLFLKKIGRPRLIGQKLGRIPEGGDRRGRAAAWGHEREPEIAREVLARYAMVPESRVFRAADNPRKLASPDGVGVNFDGELLTAEIKTHGPDIDIAPGSVEYRKKGYYLQMVWQMRVLGARRCLYATEERWDDGHGWFTAGEQRFYWIEWDEEARRTAAVLDALADEFLVALDEAAAEPFEDLGIDEELDTLAVNVLTGRVYEAQAKALKEPAWKELLARLDGRPAFTQESALARVTWTPAAAATTADVPDVEAAKAADPDLFAEVQALSKRWNEHAAKYTKTVPVAGKPQLTVTAVKTKEMES